MVFRDSCLPVMPHRNTSCHSRFPVLEKCLQNHMEGLEGIQWGKKKKKFKSGRDLPNQETRIRQTFYVSNYKWLIKFATLLNLRYQFSSVQSLSRVRLSATPWIAARQASLSITNSRSSLRLTSIESVMPSGHLILCRPLLLLPLIPPSIRVFSRYRIHKNLRRHIHKFFLTNLWTFTHIHTALYEEISVFTSFEGRSF